MCVHMLTCVCNLGVCDVITRRPGRQWKKGLTGRACTKRLQGWNLERRSVTPTLTYIWIGTCPLLSVATTLDWTLERTLRGCCCHATSCPCFWFVVSLLREDVSVSGIVHTDVFLHILIWFYIRAACIDDVANLAGRPQSQAACSR